MFALGGRAFTKSLADRLDLPFPRAEALKVDYARGLDGRATERGRGRSSPTTSRSGRPASSSSLEELAGGRPAARRASTSAAAARGCPRSARRSRPSGSGSTCRSAGRPRSASCRRTRSPAITDATEPARRPAGRHAARRWPTRRSSTQRRGGPARRRAPARPAGDEGLAVAPIASSTSTSTTRSRRRPPHPQRDRDAGRPRRAGRLAARHVAHQLPAARPRGAVARPGPVDRGARRLDPGHRRIGRPGGLPDGARLRGGHGWWDGEGGEAGSGGGRRGGADGATGRGRATGPGSEAARRHGPAARRACPVTRRTAGRHAEDGPGGLLGRSAAADLPGR